MNNPKTIKSTDSKFLDAIATKFCKVWNMRILTSGYWYQNFRFKRKFKNFLICTNFKK